MNRATLERQLLLDRSELPVLDAVEHLVGLQAQIPLNPYLGLWSRLSHFRPESLSRLLVERAVVRIVVIRGTIHLVSAADCRWLRPLEQPVLDAEIAHHPDHGPALRGVDLEPVLAFARKLLAEPRTGPELPRRAARRSSRSSTAPRSRSRAATTSHSSRHRHRGVWGASAGIRVVTAEAWLGAPLAPRPSIDDLVLRYLAAFGPATPADVGAWSRLTGMREVFDRLRPRLRPFRDERDRELFDLPDAPRPDAGAAAPPRFLPEYDNVLLAHTDRSRFGFEDHGFRPYIGYGPLHGTVLIDGMVRATWHVDAPPDGETAVLGVDHVGSLTKRATTAVAAEGRRMLRLTAPDATTHEVRVAPRP